MGTKAWHRNSEVRKHPFRQMAALQIVSQEDTGVRCISEADDTAVFLSWSMCCEINYDEHGTPKLVTAIPDEESVVGDTVFARFGEGRLGREYAHWVNMYELLTAWSDWSSSHLTWGWVIQSGEDYALVRDAVVGPDEKGQKYRIFKNTRGELLVDPMGREWIHASGVLKEMPRQTERIVFAKARPSKNGRLPRAIWIPFEESGSLQKLLAE